MVNIAKKPQKPRFEKQETTQSFYLRFLHHAQRSDTFCWKNFTCLYQPFLDRCIQLRWVFQAGPVQVETHRFPTRPSPSFPSWASLGLAENRASQVHLGYNGPQQQFRSGRVELVLENPIIFLAGGIATPLKNMKVNWDDDIPDIWKNNPVMFQSPPTRF